MSLKYLKVISSQNKHPHHPSQSESWNPLSYAIKLIVVQVVYFVYNRQNNKINKMKSITASQAKQEFGSVIMRSQIAPISVTRNGNPVSVIMSETEYQSMKLQNLRAALIEGEHSGDAGTLDMEAIKLKARMLLNNAENT